MGIAAYFVLFGALIASILEFFDTNRRFAELAAAAGFGGLDSANGFAAALFGLLAIPTGLYAAARLAALVTDERARRWTPVFATDIPRIHLVGKEIAVTTAGMILLHVTAGLAMWAGAAITGAPLTIGDALSRRAELRVGRLARGRRCHPGRRLAAVGCRRHRCGAGGGRLLAQRSSPTGRGAPTWVAGMSPFAHLAAVPNAAPNWAATAAFIADRRRPGRRGYYRICPS